MAVVWRFCTDSVGCTKSDGNGCVFIVAHSGIVVVLVIVILEFNRVSTNTIWRALLDLYFRINQMHQKIFSQ